MSIFAHPGETLEASAVFEMGLVGTLGFQIIDTPSGGVITARTTLGIVERPTGSGIYHVSTLAPTALGTYSVIWDDTDQYAAEELVVAFQHPAAPPVGAAGPTFATAEDVASRLGRALTEAEEDQVEFLLLAATAVITDAVGKTAEWAQGLDVPPVLRFVCVELVVRALANPDGSNATREQLGEYSYSQSFGEYGGLSLIAAWERMVCLAVWGTGAASARTDSIAFDAEPHT